jgi:uncharacterized coiled-coil protein SlyX
MQKPQLGELLVQHGVITSDELVLVLAEQRQTGRPLGEIVVTLGLAPGPIVAQALATQHGGGIMKTEYGYATGWQAELVEESLEAKVARLEAWIALARETIATRDATIAELQAALANPWAEVTTHLLLVQDGERYELTEADGPPPAVGALAEGRRVSQVAPCAYLLD